MWSLIIHCVLFCCLSKLSEGSGDYLTVDLSGTLNIILSAPHGGTIENFTPGIPDREDGCYINGECVYRHNCGTHDPTRCEVKTTKDYKTDDIAAQLWQEIYALKGEYPKMVISNIHRKKLDPNRKEDEATLGEPLSTTVYHWYHGNISAGICMFGGANGILFDIHGYNNANDQDRAMLGYLISKRQLNNNDDAGLETLVNVSSIEQLAAAKAESHTFSDLLRGSVSFGASMKRTGLDAVPSPVNRSPGRAGYYSGGYITKTYKARIDAIQIEIHYYHRRRASRRRNYAKALARAIVEFYDQHYL